MKLRVPVLIVMIPLLGQFLSTPTAAAAPTVPTVAPSVTQSGIWGGGFINVIARDPRKGSNKFVIGGDTAGLHLSLDAGQSWTTSNAGLDDLDQTTIASVTYRLPPHDNELYATFGDGLAADSGVIKSTNGGQSWSPIIVTGDVLPNFNGHTSGGAAAYQFQSSPRATGKLLALDEPGGTLQHIYAGTFGTGVIRSDDGGLTWTRIALGDDGTNPNCNFTSPTGDFHGCFVTSVALSPFASEPDTLYVSVHGGDPVNCLGNGICGGVFKITGAACVGNGCADATAVRLDGTPATPVNAEEILFLNKTLLCACGTDGFYSKTPTDATLVQHNTNLAFDLGAGTAYPSITARVGSIFLGSFNPACELIDQVVSCHTLYESTDQGLTWTDITFSQPAGNIVFTVAGTDVEWWESPQTASMIDGADYNSAAMALTDNRTPRLLVVGHSGVWKTTAADQKHWQPAVQGIGATTTLDVVADPNHPGYVYEGVKDWETFASISNFDPGTIVDSSTPGSEVPHKTSGFSLAVDLQDPSVPSSVYMAAGIAGPSPSINVAGVYVDPDPTSQPWVNQGFVTNGTCGSRLTPRVTGIGLQRPTPTDPPMIFAATDGCGMYRFRNGAWLRVGAATDMFTIEDFFFNYSPISVPNGLGLVVYALDRKTGKLWRSENGGLNWSPIFTIPSGERDFNSGWMVADPNALTSSIVWLATNSATGLHELTCTSSCQVPSNWTDTNVTTVPNPGPIAIPPCTQPCTSAVYVSTRVLPGDVTQAALYKSTPTGSFCNVAAGAKLWAGAGGFPVQLFMTPDGLGAMTGFLITVGNGTIVVSDTSGSSCEGA
jgi:hypothetical protein